MTTAPPRITVFHFSPAWGLPTSGPFALKLLAWLALHDLGWDSEVENNPRKGPAGKSPWAQIDGEVIPDSDRIIAHLAGRLGIRDAEADLSPPERGIAHAFKTAYEERVHQILEYELFLLPEGSAFIKNMMRESLPGVVAAAAFKLMQRQFGRQLHARGIARHSGPEILVMARQEFGALSDLLGTRSFICGDAPGLADLSCFGQLAPMLRWDMSTPAADQLKRMDRLVRWCDEVEARCFGTPSAKG